MQSTKLAVRTPPIAPSFRCRVAEEEVDPGAGTRKGGDEAETGRGGEGVRYPAVHALPKFALESDHIEGVFI